MKELPVSLTSLTEQTRRIPIDNIRESLVTLRIEYDEEKLKELGDSLVDRGQLQTIVVQPGDDNNFDLVIGSRRLRAARLKGLSGIAAYVIEKRSPVELLFIALAENLHRADLNPFEEAQGFLRLMKEYELPVKDIAKGVNKPESYVRGRLQLLSMPEEVVTMVSDQTLPINIVRTLARLPTGEDQVRLARAAVKHHLTQSELSTQVRQELEEPVRVQRESYELTPVKVQARVGEFVAFLQKVPRRMKMRRMNASEKQAVLTSLQALEDEVRSLRETVRGASTAIALPLPLNVTRDHTTPSNHGQEWTTRDIRRINSPRRPSDEELAVEIGRSVGAIKVMRSLTREKVR